MYPKHYFYSLLCITLGILLFCFLGYPYISIHKTPPTYHYSDGIYTGEYKDGNSVQIRIEFQLQKDTFLWFKFHELQYKDGSYLSGAATQAQKEIAGQFIQLTDFLTGKSVSDISALYKPEFIASDADAISSATLKASKLIWAVWDGLEASPSAYSLNTCEDGTYRGFAYQDGSEQIALQFVIIDGKFQSFTYRTLSFNGQDYLNKSNSAALEPIASQYMTLSNSLIGLPVSSIKEFIESDTAEITQDVIFQPRKLAEAIVNGLKHHPYVQGEATVLPLVLCPLDGKYTAVSSPEFSTPFKFHFQVKDGRFQMFHIEKDFTNGAALQLLDSLTGQPVITLHELPHTAYSEEISYAIWHALS